MLKGVKYTDNEGSRIHWWVLPAGITEKEISEVCDISFNSDYNGPGNRYWDCPDVKRGKFRTLVTVHTALDI
jgi:hypothetical protein